ncbi:hypothetical protein LJ707_02565 [Mucilaginibacter sp. UR6-1]|uniref:hypothetical protein n=1 Tax=Mucilaginibacter sp. UR6-1 TaxID=1435643 RepID=UPI001E363BA2|nr:hypothetical protein [Mucilaginibacter sp. UR6-1]MCC8407796.1 hypothetical protein [Mucilaginibacter sp. UR6-1]
MKKIITLITTVLIGSGTHAQTGQASTGADLIVYHAGKAVSGNVLLAEDNRFTREEALRLYTIGAA